MIVWTDVESTGLDERNGHLLEVALVLTDDELVEQGHFSVVVQPVGTTIDATVANMDVVVREMHTANGLIAELREGGGVRRYEAEEHIIKWLKGPCTSPEQEKLSLESLSKVPLAGSTVGFDRRWLREHMPRLEALFSYRSIDVSSITELARRWSPSTYEGRPKAGKAHRALADVRESIAYLKYYSNVGFIAGRAA